MTLNGSARISEKHKTSKQLEAECMRTDEGCGGSHPPFILWRATRVAARYEPKKNDTIIRHSLIMQRGYNENRH